MGTLPQLIEEDVQCLETLLRELLAKTDATTALVIDKGGFLISAQGDTREFDLTTIAALASGAYMANQTIANLVHESNFNSVYQQGERYSMFILCVDEYCMLVVIFRAQFSVGVVKYYAVPAAQQIAAQLLLAQQRNPTSSLDLSALNLADARDLFRKRV